jgi:hypothetical protein
MKKRVTPSFLKSRQCCHCGACGCTVIQIGRDRELAWCSPKCAANAGGFDWMVAQQPHAPSLFDTTLAAD